MYDSDDGDAVEKNLVRYFFLYKKVNLYTTFFIFFKTKTLTYHLEICYPNVFFFRQNAYY